MEEAKDIIHSHHFYSTLILEILASAITQNKKINKNIRRGKTVVLSTSFICTKSFGIYSQNDPTRSNKWIL